MMFSHHGIPISLKTDNGPQFTSREFYNYLSENGVKHNRSTPYWPQANGEVERQNRTLLKAFRTANAENRDWRKEIPKFLLAYRSTPHSTTGKSPAELLFNRKIRTKLPEIDAENRKDDADTRRKDFEMKEKGKIYADQKRKTRESDIDREGSRLTLKNNEGNISQRNSSFVKKFNGQINEEKTLEYENIDNNIEDTNENEHTDTEVNLREDSSIPSRPKRENVTRVKRFCHELKLTTYLGPVGVISFFIVATIVNEILMSPVVNLVFKNKQIEGNFRFINLSDYFGKIRSHLLLAISIFGGLYDSLSSVDLSAKISSVKLWKNLEKLKKKEKEATHHFIENESIVIEFEV
ncbi:unnamed protein product [Mytilus coruscus]|uniref:Integrase catalytic domain-containing protein n=1 Tax=Mytilus coruscus TaxID=42192 RepID=A0A6J8CLM4_MYTCO|nr:unnamed protein product [Mytilus coruscus]